MKTLRKISLLMLITGFTIHSYAQETLQKKQPQNKEAKEMKETKKPKKLKKHVCTEECHTTGHHVYKHGEKGHTCDESCKMQ